MLTESNAIDVIIVDERVVIEPDTEYAVEIRKSDGTFVFASVVSPAGTTNELLFAEPVSASEAPKVGDFFAFGKAGKVTLDAIITAIEPKADSGPINTIDYAPDIFAVIDDPGLEIPPPTQKYRSWIRFVRDTRR
jgi:hypothetical protein